MNHEITIPISNRDRAEKQRNNFIRNVQHKCQTLTCNSTTGLKEVTPELGDYVIPVLGEVKGACHYQFGESLESTSNCARKIKQTL